MKIKKQFIKKNYRFFLTCIIVLIITIFLSQMIDNPSSTVEIKELKDSGTNHITKLVINEVMSSNKGVLSDSQGNLYDWIELYNGTDKNLQLKNYGLSDEDNKIKWLFPDTVIKAKTYLIIYLSGTTQEGLYANFKLKSSKGETVALKKPNGKTVDAVDVPSLEGNQSLSRDLNGKWFVTNTSTPGYQNTKEGYEEYIKHITKNVGSSDIKINEILPRNKGNFKDAEGNNPGYIEIINEGTKTINLKGYSLSDTYTAPYKWSFPNINVKPNEVIAVYMGNSLSDTELYSKFKLEEKNGVALLSNQAGIIIDRIEYENLPNGMAMSKGKETIEETSFISPGYPNNEKGINEFSNKMLKNPSDLIINEVMNNNTKYLGQNGNEYYDWIELKNNSNKNLDLSKYYLTTSDSNKKMYQLPKVTLKKGEYYVVMASGDSNLSNNTYKHIPFKLSDVESLYITSANKIIDSIFIANIPVNYSMGRNNETGFFYYSNPTPKANNNQGTREIAMAPIIDQKAGIYNNIDCLTINIKGNGTIYYTLDGSKPSKSSNIYNGPLFFNKTTVLKAIIYDPNKLPSDVITKTFVINENHKIPVLSLSLNQSEFNNLERNSWKEDLESPAYLELFEEDKGFSIPCGFELFGGSTRGLPKKSYQIKFRKAYGASKLNYQVFETRDFSSFNSLVLRSGSQDYEYAFIRDILGTSLMDKVENVEVQAYKSVILYINGKYWGIYNIREKVEAEFVANHYNVDKDKANIVRIDNNVTVGSNDWYRHIVDYVSNNDMSKSNNYEYIKTKIDIQSLADFWIAESYVTNNDIINARFFSHPDIDSGKMKTIFYDLDWAWYNYTRDYFKFSTSTTPMSRLNVSTAVLRNLMKNSEFRKTYVERLSYQMNNIWTEENVLAKIDELYNLLKEEIPRNQERWNLTVKVWEDSIEELKVYAKNRRKYMLDQAKSYFNLSDEEMKKKFN